MSGISGENHTKHELSVFKLSVLLGEAHSDPFFVLIPNCGYKKEKIITIPSGVFVDHYKRDLSLGSTFKKQYRLFVRDYIFGMITRLHQIKGVDIVIEAFKLLSSTTAKNISLIVVDEGEEENNLKRMITDLDWKKRFRS